MRIFLKLTLALIIFQTTTAFAIDVEQEYVRSSFDKTTQTTLVELGFIVDRPLEEVRIAMDPQSWDICSPKYFKQHDVIDATTGKVMKNPPAPGSNWEGITLEKVVFPLIGLPAAKIVNHLWWTSKRIDDGGKLRHRYEYGLHKSLKTRFFALAQKGGVVIDDGWVNIEENGDGRWRVTGIKMIKFDLISKIETNLINRASPTLFTQVLPEMGRDLVGCDLP